MASPSSSSLLLFMIIIICNFLFFSPEISLAFNSEHDVTLLGDAYFNNGAISLTQELNPSSSSSSSSNLRVGRALYTYPIRFLDPVTKTTASFISRFTFTITPSPSSPFGDGLTFLITSNARSVGSSSGFIGLPNQTLTLDSAQESFIAVEFDTNFDPFLDDINDNHIGLDINSVISVSSVDATSIGVDLKGGKPMTAWIEYNDSKKMIRVWISYTEIRPTSPILASRVDLSVQLKEFMHVGFTASNGNGAATHQVEKWRFKTFGFLPANDSDKPMDTGEAEPGNCLMCTSTPDVGFGFGFDSSSFGSVDRDLKRSTRAQVAIGLGEGAAFLASAILVIGGLSWFLVKKKKFHCSGGHNLCTTAMEDELPRRLSLAEIQSATRGFHRSRIVGEGASGTVYEGFLMSGKEVAVKRFNRISQVDPFTDPFTNEFAAMAGSLKHKNLVQLQGWCCESNELILVYEYFPHGSLDKFLHKTNGSPAKLVWPHRLQIVLGVASALTYLHEECEKQIIHRDVKACNIMLDSDFNPKLGDFGLAELYERNGDTREATTPAGTMGYLAPEYVHSGVPSEKSDVYSFGVVVLEVATGRRPVDNEGVVLVDWVWDMWGKGKLMEAADRRLMGRFDWNEMEAMLMVGLACVHPNCMERPSIKEAARMITGEAPLPVLPSRKPVVRLQSQLPEGTEDILQRAQGRATGLQGSPPWYTPQSRF